MRTIKWSTDFKKDYRRTKATPRHAQDIDGLLEPVAALLAEDKPLPDSCRDHALVGNWKGYREFQSVFLHWSQQKQSEKMPL